MNPLHMSIFAFVVGWLGISFMILFIREDKLMYKEESKLYRSYLYDACIMAGAKLSEKIVTSYGVTYVYELYKIGHKYYKFTLLDNEVIDCQNVEM